MFACHYGYRPPPCADTDRETIVVVKVINLNKSTTRGDLRTRLSRFNILKIKLIQCEKKRVNYAHIHLSDRDTAQRLVDAVHNKMEVHSNLLRAILKEDQSISYEDTLRKNLDTNIVEILTYDKEVNVADRELKQHFAKYGELDTLTTVYDGHPRLLHMRYTNAISAYAARYNSPHCIANTTVVALPLPNPKEVEPNEFATTSFPCDPVVIANAEKTLLREFDDAPELKIQTKGNTIVVHTRGEMTGVTERNIERAIRTSESMISKLQFESHCYCLPILAESETQKCLAEIATPLEITVQRGRDFVSLETLKQDYNSRLGDSIKSLGIKQYLSPSTSARARDNVQHQWYWQDDSKNYQPYTEEVNKKIEQNFETESHLFPQIGRFIYIISFTRMIQINVATEKRRSIKREQIQSDEALVLTMQLRAHQGHCMLRLKRTILSLIAKFTAEVKFQVPDSAI